MCVCVVRVRVHDTAHTGLPHPAYISRTAPAAAALFEHEQFYMCPPVYMSKYIGIDVVTLHAGRIPPS